MKNEIKEEASRDYHMNIIVGWLFFVFTILLLSSFIYPVNAKLSVNGTYGLYESSISKNQYFTFFTNQGSVCKLFINGKKVLSENHYSTNHQFYIKVSFFKKGKNRFLVNCSDKNDSVTIKKNITYNPTTPTTTPTSSPVNQSKNDFVSLLMSPMILSMILILVFILIVWYLLSAKSKNKNIKNGTSATKSSKSWFSHGKKNKNTENLDSSNPFLFSIKSDSNRNVLEKRIKQRYEVFDFFDKDLINDINSGKVSQEKINKFLDELDINGGIWLSINQLKEYLMKSDKFWDIFTRLKVISSEKLKNWSLENQIKVIKRIVFARSLSKMLNNLVTNENLRPMNQTYSKEVNADFSKAVVEGIIKIIVNLYKKSDFDVDFLGIVVKALVNNHLLAVSDVTTIGSYLMDSGYMNEVQVVSFLDNIKG